MSSIFQIGLVLLAAILATTSALPAAPGHVRVRRQEDSPPPVVEVQVPHPPVVPVPIHENATADIKPPGDHPPPAHPPPVHLPHPQEPPKTPILPPTNVTIITTGGGDSNHGNDTAPKDPNQGHDGDKPEEPPKDPKPEPPKEPQPEPPKEPQPEPPKDPKPDDENEPKPPKETPPGPSPHPVDPPIAVNTENSTDVAPSETDETVLGIDNSGETEAQKPIKPPHGHEDDSKTALIPVVVSSNGLYADGVNVNIVYRNKFTTDDDKEVD